MTAVDELLDRYVEQHLETGFPPDLAELCAEAPDLRPELETLVREYHELDGSFGMPAKDLVGKSIGSLRLLKRLGSGVVSDVYDGLDVGAATARVAVKVFPAFVLAEAGARERFERLQRLAAQEQPPGCCALHRCGEGEGVAFLCLERCEGGVWRPEDPLRDGRRILQALTNLHGHVVAVGDLRPAAIVGGPRGATLLAYGVSSLRGGHLPRGQGAYPLSAAAFAAPEQLDGAAEITTAADLFSWASLVAFWLTEELPFDGASRQEMRDAMRDAAPPVAAGEARDLLQRCWSERPADRPSAAQASDELSRVLSTT